MLTANTGGTCRVCSKPFLRLRSTQAVCSVRCATLVPKIARKAEIQARKVTRAQRDAVKPRGKWMGEAQAAFNGFVRARDAHLPCISCQRMHEGSWDAGHFWTTGARPELRFHEDNCHRQCVPCNQHKHGNLLLYRRHLIERIGQGRFDALEAPHPPLKLTIPELRAIRDDYRKRLKAMKP